MTIKGKTARKRAQALNKAQEKSENSRKARSDAQSAKGSNGVNKPLTKAQKAAFAAKAALEAEHKAETKACFAEIQEVLKKHGCRMLARPVTVPRNDGLFVLGADVVILKAPLEMSEETSPDE